MTEPETEERRGMGELHTEQVYELLSSQTRRQVITALKQSGGVSTFEDIASDITAAQRQSAGSESNQDEKRRIKIALYHSHLPKLDDYGIVEWDRDSGLVELSDRVSKLLWQINNGPGSELPGDKTMGERLRALFS